VQAVVDAEARGLRAACWDRRFAGWKKAEIEWGLAVDPSGAVVPQATAADTLAALERDTVRAASDELARCVGRHVEGWNFPRATQPTWLRVRISFLNN